MGSRQGSAQLPAGLFAIFIRFQVADHEIAGKVCAGCFAASFPDAHPFSVTPVIGAKQRDFFTAELSFARREHRIEFILLQDFISHCRAAESDRIIVI